MALVADEKQDALDAEVQPEVYAPHTQDSANEMSLVVRTRSDPEGLIPAVRREVAAVDPNVALYDLRTMEQVVAESLAEERFSTLLLSGFALIALLLAVVGLYGLVAYSVTERTREIGVRIALGASRPVVLRLVMWSGLRPVVAGVAVGIGGSMLAARAIQGFLFQTPSADPTVLAGVAVAFGATGLGASFLPAARAAGVDPAVSLRAE